MERRLILSATAIDLTSAPFVDGMGYQLSNDTFYMPDSPLPAGDTTTTGTAASSPPAGSRPYGASASDTSEFMSGDVSVTVVLLESNGAIDPSTENWTAGQITSVKSEITEGLNWWKQCYINKGYTGSLNFNIDFTYADTPFQTSYEPINHPASDDLLWINQFLTSKGYGTGFSGVDSFNDAQRLAHNTDWAYTVFVANSLNDTDGMFTDSYFGYAYLGGPFLQMTYDNDGWGIGNMGQVLAHETGHIFYALDEYPGSGGKYTDHSGYYNTQNLNAADGNPNPSSRVASLMAEASLQNAAYPNHTSSPTSFQMVGWQDTDGDHIIDILDQPFTLTSTSGSFDAANNQYVFSATSAVTTLSNNNPNSARHAITLNEIDRLQYRIDGGGWTNFNASAYHVTSKTFTNIRIDMPPTWSTIDLRTISDESNETSPTFSDTNTTPSVTLAAAPASMAENGGTSTITATLNHTSASTVTVNLGFTGTATNISDYTRSDTSITIAAGSLTGSITLTGVDDAIFEGTETVVVDITSVTNGNESGTQQATVSILDDETPPTVQFTSASQSAAENAGTMTITAQLSAAVGVPVTIPFALGGTATGGGVDYTITASPITIAAGNTTATITINVVNDALDERDETVIVTMGAPTNATAAGTTVHTATILDNHAPVLNAIGNKSVNELATLSFTAVSPDPYAPASSHVFSLDAGAPAGASIDPATGVFTWTPGEVAGPGVYPITVRVTESGGLALSDCETISVTVNEVNVAPVLSAIPNYSINENTLLTFTAAATDADLPPQTLTYSLDSGAPPGAVINPTTGVFTWTPYEAQGPGVYSITARVTDNGPGLLSDARTFTVTVAEVNSPPNLAAIGDKNVDEGSLLSFTAVVSDPDLPVNVLTYSLDAGAPTGASINSTTGLFTWTPTEAQGPGVYTVTARVTDSGGLSAAQSFVVTVNEVNQPPAITAIPQQTVNEGALVSFTATATDPDNEAKTIAFSLGSGAPAGATINPATGAFTWQTAEIDGPGTYNVTILATDDGVPPATGSRALTIVVNEVNQAPVLGAISNKSVNELTQLTFSASATDADLPAQALSYSLDSGDPAGASINASTGIFTWTPTEAQGPGVYWITVRVTDNASSPLSDARTFTVTVGEVNVAPALAAIPDKTVGEKTPLSFNAVGTDSDLPANKLTYSLDAGAPAGAGIDPSTGLFAWTPAENQGPGVYSVTVRVTDDGTPAISAARTFSITVNEVNEAPVLNPIGNKTAPEKTPLTFTASASDPDIPASTLTYSLVNFPPAGASIDPATGVFTWTPTEAQGHGTYHLTVRVTDNGSPAMADEEAFDIVVTEVNEAPVLAGISDLNLNEQTTVTFTASATDADLPANGLTYSLDPGAPAGASIAPATGVFTWTPAESQGPGTYPITVRVTDSGSPAMSDYQTFNVTVNEVNRPPVLAAIGNKSVNEGSALAFTAAAADPDLPANSLVYSLDAGAPAGASINPATGAFTWTPSEAQGPGTYSITIRVTDNGTPALNDSETISVNVAEVNGPPVLSAIPDHTIGEGNLLTFPAVATDSDQPPNTLAYSLDAGAPAGASINPATGLFTWTPAETQGPGVYAITIRVTDNGVPALNDAKTFHVNVGEVNQPPTLAPIPDATLNEGDVLAFSAAGNDADWPANSLTYSLDPGAPAGATIDPATGAFSFQPADGPSTLSITVRVTDSGTPALSATRTLTVNVNNVAPSASFDGPASGLEGSPLAFTASASDPGAADIAAGLNYSWTVTRDQSTYDTASGTNLANWSFTPDDNGAYQISLVVTDKDGLSTTVADQSVIVDNVAPQAQLADPGPVREGSSAALQVAQTTDSAADLAAGLHYAFDFTNDGTFDLGDGTYADSGTATSAAFPDTLFRNGVGTFTARVRVIDKDGASADVLLDVQVVNAPPAASIAAPTALKAGQAASFTLTAQDVSPADQGAPFTFTINWGDGTKSQRLGPIASGSLANHKYAKPGQYTITILAADHTGQRGPAATQTISVSGAQLVASPTNTRQKDLLVTGTAGRDTISILPASTGVSVTLNGANLGVFNPTGRIIIFGQDGNDSITLKCAGYQALIFGGAGNDVINGGANKAIEVGGDGNDRLTGGAARDILIGGDGADQLNGAGEADILIRGATAYDVNPTALSAILREWLRTDLTPAQRKQHIAGIPGGYNGAFFLVTIGTRTVQPGLATDIITGKTPADWLFA